MQPTSNGSSVMAQGRIVWVSGDLFKGKVKTEFGTQTPKRNAQGEVMMEYGFGLAIPKSALVQGGAGYALWEAMYREAMTMYPSGQIPPSFAMKFKDGDGIDDQGRPFNQREGHGEHIVFAMTTSMPIKYFRFENGQNMLINDGIKCGDYVNVQVNIKAHPAIGAGKAGLYLNPNAVQFLGYGKEIINTPSGDQIFGTQLPPAMGSATPIAPQPGLLVPPSGVAAAPAMPQQPAYPPMAPAAPAPVTPHYGVVPQAFQPPPGGQPMGVVPAAYPGTPAPVGMPPYPGAPR